MPSTAPATVCAASSPSARANPKSASFGTPSDVRSMFPGLMSRWMIPAACACPKPSQTWLMILIDSSTGIAPVLSLSASVPPSTYSMTMYGPCSSWPESWTVTILLCLSLPSDCASVRNRLNAVGFDCPLIRLIATLRFIPIWIASRTSPIPPWPMTDWIW